MNKQQITGIIILVAIIAGGIGYVTGVNRGGNETANVSDAALLAKLDEAKKVFAPAPDSNFISGKVESINGRIITLNTPVSNPFDESPQVRQITVTSATKIVKFVGESSSFTEKEISLSSIKAGDQIDVEAATPIRMLEKFEATKITWEPIIAPSAGASAAVPSSGVRVPSQ